MPYRKERPPIPLRKGELEELVALAGPPLGDRPLEWVREPGGPALKVNARTAWAVRKLAVMRGLITDDE